MVQTPVPPPTPPPTKGMDFYQEVDWGTEIFMNNHKVIQFSLNQSHISWAGGIAQVVECLPHKREALSSNTYYHQKKDLF
jgi:hypothetical protein